MKSPELTEFFSLLGKAKKEKKEEFDNLLKEADINLDVLTSSVVTGIKEAKVNIKKQKKDAIKACLPLSVVFSTVLYPLLGILYCDLLLENFSILKKMNTNKIKKNDS